MPTFPEPQLAQRHSLAPHAFVCLDGDHVVLLDVRQDRYLALEEIHSRCLETLIPGWPVRADGAPRGAPNAAEAERVAQLLMARKLLAGNCMQGKDATPVRIEKPVHGFAPDDYLDRAPLQFPAVVSFVAAVATARYAARFWPFERLVRRVKRRNEKHLSPAAQVDLPRLEGLIATFGQLRPFLFASREACLFESFALLEFLARHGIYANWVFGVQARPFAAHCWVQQHRVVLNDTVESASGYTPIMVV